MSICDSEENRKKLAWLVPGYILLAWFFCVLFQPLGIHNPNATANAYNGDENYEIIYLTRERSNLWYLMQNHGLTEAGNASLSPSSSSTSVPESDTYVDVCSNNGTVITLERGAKSAVIIRLGQSSSYKYMPFNCSLQIKAGSSLSGLTAVVEEMDLREQEDDVRLPGGHWGSSLCVDYLEAYTDKSKVKNKLCGKWNIHGNDRLNSHGPKQTLVGYCYDDRSGHSCESQTIFLNVMIDNRDLGERYGLNSKRRKGFSVVVTGYRHPDKVVMHDKPPLAAPSNAVHDMGRCDPDTEFTCPIRDFSLHNDRDHCIWKNLRCDSHQNCGFTFNKDENGCSAIGSMNPWSVSTMTLLIIIYLAIVLILVLVTMMLLRWHKVLRSPLDVLNDGRGVPTATSDIAAASMITTGLPDGSTTTEARAGTVSIIVSYRPQKPKDNNEPPPSYDSLFRGDPATLTASDEVAEESSTTSSPPTYQSVAAECVPNAAVLAAAQMPSDSEQMSIVPIALLPPEALEGASAITISEISPVIVPQQCSALAGGAEERTGNTTAEEEERLLPVNSASAGDDYRLTDIQSGERCDCDCDHGDQDNKK